jgi:Zn-finger nucleic acid-binding protein
MHCPVCKVDLVMADRHGVEIDYCPKCRGVWLDRGELDKIVERSAGDGGAFERDDDRDSGEYRRPVAGTYGSGHHGKKKRKSFLGELFDFD